MCCVVNVLLMVVLLMCYVQSLIQCLVISVTLHYLKVAFDYSKGDKQENNHLVLC